jgi:GNAT superfamily N-acetyltransferase
LHDIGLTETADRGARFEVDGADAAVQLLCANGLDPQAADIVWQAIALHTSGGIAERRAPEVALTRAGIGMDFGLDAHLIDDALAAAVHERYRRLQIARNLTDAIVDQARGRPNKAPAYSLPAGLVAERSQDRCLTALERQALASRWGE